MGIMHDWIEMQCPHCFKRTRYTNIATKEASKRMFKHVVSCPWRYDNGRQRDDYDGFEPDNSP